MLFQKAKLVSTAISLSLAHTFLMRKLPIGGDGLPCNILSSAGLDKNAGVHLKPVGIFFFFNLSLPSRRILIIIVAQ